MINKFPVKIIAIIMLLFVVWLWYVSRSADEPRVAESSLGGLIDAQAQKATTDSNQSQSLIVEELTLDKELAQRFQATASLIEQGNEKQAISELNEIIRLKPHAIEPYINLAALHAKSQNVDQASEILKKAIQVNGNTSVLFDSLQKVYAAQASLAYQRALEIKTIDDEALAVNLPVIDTLTINKPNASEIELRQKVAARAERINELQNNLEGLSQEKSRLLELNTQLKAQANEKVAPELLVNLQEQVADLKSTHAEQLAKLERQLAQEAEKSANEALALNKQIEQQNLTIASLEKANAESSRLALLASQESDVIESVIATVDVEPAQNSLPIDDSLVAEGSSTAEGSLPAEGSSIVEGSDSKPVDNNEVAIGLVRAWASSWAAQDVASYIEHYEPQYRPASGISHQQWREQRQVRLTNKTFINVNVNNFKVKDLGSTFSVTFLQHYKSNNVDDKIIKKLTFAKNNNDWQQAKIIQEQVITN